MVNSLWQCECGKTNSFAYKYCMNCQKEISYQYLEKICAEEYLLVRRLIKREDQLSAQKRINWQIRILQKACLPGVLFLELFLGVGLGISIHYGNINGTDVFYNCKEVISNVSNSVHDGAVGLKKIVLARKLSFDEKRKQICVVEDESLLETSEEIAIKIGDVASKNVHVLQKVIGDTGERLSQRIDSLELERRIYELVNEWNK